MTTQNQKTFHFDVSKHGWKDLFVVTFLAIVLGDAGVAVLFSAGGGGRTVRAADLGQMGRGVDIDLAISRSGERGAHGRRFPLPHFVGERRDALRAGFGIPVPLRACPGFSVPLVRPRSPVRQWIHE
jgi:hypothetical protein